MCDVIIGPMQARVRWVEDTEPYDPGDTDHCEDHDAFTRGCETCERYRREVVAYVETWGVYGCIVEAREPSCCHYPPQWEEVASLWSIVGDQDYHREVESDLFAEVTRG